MNNPVFIAKLKELLLDHIKSSPEYDSLVCSNGDTFWLYDENQAIWEEQLKTYELFDNLLISLYDNDLNKQTINEFKLEHKETFDKILSKRNFDFLDNLAKSLASDLTNIEFCLKIDSMKHCINFQDVLYDLKTGETRIRTKEDYVSITLPFEYQVTKSPDALKRQILIAFDADVELVEFLFSWLGYCMTGETKEKRCLINIGNNIIFKMFEDAFWSYVFDVDNRLFCSKYTKTKKHFDELGEMPFRTIFIDDIRDKDLDVDSFAEFINGKCDRISSELHCKLILNVNKKPAFLKDKKLNDLCAIVEIKDDFDDDIEFIINDLLAKIDKNEYKMAFIKLLVPYATAYYANGLAIPERFKNTFKNTKKPVLENVVEEPEEEPFYYKD